MEALIDSPTKASSDGVGTNDGSAPMSAVVPDGYGPLEAYCVAWGKTFAAVYSWARNGKLDAIRVGRKLLVRLDASPPDPFFSLRRAR